MTTRLRLPAAALVVLAGTVSAFGEECRFADGDSYWVDFDPMIATLHRPDGTSESCDLTTSGTESTNWCATCGEYGYAFFTASSVMGSDAHDLLIFMNSLFYWTCSGDQRTHRRGSDESGDAEAE
jgi:hypothetical protein